MVKHVKKAQLAGSFPNHDEDGVKKVKNLPHRSRSHSMNE